MTKRPPASEPRPVVLDQLRVRLGRGASTPIRRTRLVAAQARAEAVVVAAGDPAHLRGSLLALARMSSRHTVMITGPGAQPDVGERIAGARLQRDPVAAAIEVDVLVFTPAG